MNKYSSGDFLFSQLRNAVVLPNFQRRLVWSKNQKESFIETLHNGYPFGSILVYKYNSESEKKYTLIDGLQRYTTILDFEQSPQNYINFDEEIERLYSIINSHDMSSAKTASLEKRIRSLLKQALDDMLKNKTQNKGYALVDILSEKISSDIYSSNSDERKINELQDNISDKIKNYINIENIIIPYIEFTGDENELATVFENLNRGGKKLSKYQVFAAQWSYFDISLDDTRYSKEILEKVISRYESLIKERDVEIKDFDSNEMRENKKVNLAELCGAIGEMILDVTPVFWKGISDKSEDRANAIGYSTIAITLGISNKKLTEIAGEKELFNSNGFLEDYIGKVLDEYKIINNYFEKYLKVPGEGPQKKYESKIASDFQILSIFASLWMERYKFNDKNNTFEPIPKYKNNYNQVKKNLIYYFIEDIIMKKWSGTGDSKLDNFYVEGNNRYLKVLEQEVLEESLLRWWDERSTISSINFEPLSRLLITIQSSFYKDHFSEDSYDLEHVINRDSVSKIYKEQNLAIGSLGNIMFLSSKYNRSKKTDNLFESLKEGQTLEKDFLDNSFYPAKNDFLEITQNLNKKNINTDKIKEVVTYRGKHIINNLVENLYK